MTLARTVVVCALLLGVGLWSPQLLGQTEPADPASHGAGPSASAVPPGFQIGSADADVIPAGWRLVRTFDFDERAAGNFEDLPRNWYAIGRPPDTSDPNFLRQPLHQQLAERWGFPGYAQVGFDGREHVSGRSAFWMGIHGGSAGAFLEIGTLPAVPGSDYHITTWVRTTQLKHVRATLTAYFIDAQGRKIEASAVQAAALPVNDQWQWLSVRLLGDYPEAAWIGLELTVRQPDQRDTSALGEHRIVYQDVQGGAWFDDLMIWQVPRVVVGTQSPVNIIRSPRQPRLWVHVRDFSVRALRVRVRVFDHEGGLVDEMARALGDSQAGRWWWEPRLPRLGWYLLELGLIDDQKPDGDPASMETVYGSLLWLGAPRAGPGESSVKLVLDAQGRPNDEVDLLPQFMEQLGATAGVISCWQPQTTVDNLDQQAVWLDELLGRLTAKGQEVTLSFSPLPMAMAHQINVDQASPLWMFSRPAEGWMPYVQPLLMQQGQRIRRWQLGQPGRGNLAAADELPQLIQTALTTMRQLAPGPELILPWALASSRPQQPLDDVGYAINAPNAFLPRFLPEALTPWTHTDPPADATLYLRQLSGGNYSHARRIDDLARRMVYAWRAEPSRLAMRAPWTVSTDRQVQLLPDPVAGVFATVGQLLSGRKYVQNLPLGDGIEAQIFHGPRGGMLVAWNESAELQDAVINTYLGEKITVTDVFGNQFSPPTVDGKQKVPLTHTPLFIEGIATELAIFRASFRVEPPQIPSTQEPHQHSIHLYNPWPRTISGQMLITDPKSWQIEPRRTTFSIPSGQSVTIPLWLSFPVSEVGGQQTVRARFDFVADRPYAIEMSTNVELGLSYLDWEAHLTLEEKPQGGVDLLVTQVVRNKGTQSLNLFAFAQLAEFSRQEQVISQLQPGQSLMRVFRFPDVDPHTQDQPIRVGIREDGGPAALNKVLRLY